MQRMCQEGKPEFYYPTRWVNTKKASEYKGSRTLCRATHTSTKLFAPWALHVTLEQAVLLSDGKESFLFRREMWLIIM